MILFPLLFTPLFSLSFYVPLTIYAQLLLQNQFFNHDSYYLAPIIPFLFFAFNLAIKKIQCLQVRIGILVLCFIVCICGLFSRNIIGNLSAENFSIRRFYDYRFMGVNNVFDRRIYAVDEEDRLAWDFIKMIPKNASVTASGDLLPALSARSKLYEFGLNHNRAQKAKYSPFEYPDHSVDYILIHNKVLTNGLSGDYAFLEDDDLKKEIRNLIENYGFKIVRQEGNFILLKQKKIA